MDDLISRQAALDAIKSVRIKHMAQGNDVTPIWECADEVLKVPTVEPTADLSEYSDKLWETAYERVKAEARVIKLTEADKESLRKAMENAELTLVAEPRKGKWIDGNEGKWNAVFCPKCSVCGTPFYGIETVRYHYCPNCGARMEESK